MYIALLMTRIFKRLEAVEMGQIEIVFAQPIESQQQFS